MKKQYESPKATKMEFNYKETVTASSSVHCNWHYTKTKEEKGCLTEEEQQWNEYGT